MTRDEAEYLGKLERLGCVVCRLFAESAGFDYDPPPAGSQLTVIHHPRDGVGGAQRSSHWNGVPLCVPDHNGRMGVHGDRGRIRALKIFNEMDLVAQTRRIYFETFEK